MKKEGEKRRKTDGVCRLNLNLKVTSFEGLNRKLHGQKVEEEEGEEEEKLGKGKREKENPRLAMERIREGSFVGRKKERRKVGKWTLHFPLPCVGQARDSQPGPLRK